MTQPMFIADADPVMGFATFDLPLHIIGIGAVGSTITELLSMDEVRSQFHLWDADRVEEKNYRNQTYRPQHLGMFKTEALSLQIKENWGGQRVVVHNEFIDSYRPLEGIVFMCVDTMTARRSIWETCIRGNKNVPLLIEARMSGLSATIHTLDPCNEYHQHEWERFWYPDNEATNRLPGCGGPTVMRSTVGIVAGLCEWQLKRFFTIKRGASSILYNQIRLNLDPPENPPEIADQPAAAVEMYPWILR